ncbi:MAG: hypothetical protein LH614_16650 [Pyrinomonadaceae bacterium]|nr:hypothetical protein [Pyrinomonadaceae bacterium]
MTTVIKVENLSKLYRLGGTRHNSLRDAVMSFVKNPLQSNRKTVSFDVAASLEGDTAITPEKWMA